MVGLTAIYCLFFTLCTLHAFFVYSIKIYTAVKPFILKIAEYSILMYLQALLLATIN